MWRFQITGLNPGKLKRFRISDWTWRALLCQLPVRESEGAGANHSAHLLSAPLWTRRPRPGRQLERAGLRRSSHSNIETANTPSEFPNGLPTQTRCVLAVSWLDNSSPSVRMDPLQTGRPRPGHHLMAFAIGSIGSSRSPSW